jgi:hypothetical protein
VNPNRSSRPFLRLFSASQPDQQSSDITPVEQLDSKQPSSTLDSAEKMIVGKVGPRTVQPVSVDPRRVEVSLAEIAPVLADAINHQRGWLTDFSDDTVSIDADLYEVLLAYQQMRRLDAA